jgi:hypothetical protein
MTVTAEVMKNRDFDDETRSSAMEIIVTLAEDYATLVRKYTD